MSAVPTTIPFPTGSLPPIPTGSIPGLSTVPPVSSLGSSGSSAFSTSTSSFGLSSLLSVFVDVLAILIVLGIVGVFVIVVVANRADPDPSGRRPQSVYFFAVSFVAIIVSTLASTVIVFSLTDLIGHNSGSLTNATARAVVLGGLFMLAAGALLVTHLRRGVILTRADPDWASPSRRVGQSYVAAICFVAVLFLLLAGVFAVYLVFALAGPGVFGSFGGSTPTVRYLIDAVYVGAVAGLILFTHRNLVPPGFSFLGRNSHDGVASGGSSTWTAPPPEGPPV
jgi:hypothetical protein